MTKQIGHLIRVRETCSCGRKTRATFYGGRCTFLRQGVHAPTCLEVAKHEKDYSGGRNHSYQGYENMVKAFSEAADWED